MDTSTADRVRSWTAPLGLVSCMLSAVPAFSAAEFEPEISAGVARTDNLTLVRENKESETVYEVVPAFTFFQESPALTSNVAYRLEAFRYQGRGESNVYHQLDSEVRAELDRDNFFFDAGASRRQSIIDPEGPIPRSNLPISENRTDRDQVYLGPAFEYPLAGNTTARGGYRRSWVRYGDELPLDEAAGRFRRDHDEDRFNFSLDNYRREGGFTWAIRYNAESADYGVLEPWEYRQASAELGAWIGEGLRVFATGGKESDWDQPFDPSLEESFWEVGFSKSIADRLTAELAAGERTYGSSRRASLSIAFRRGTTALSYTERPTTQGRNPYERGGLLLPDEPQDFLTRAGSAERYISKRAGWSLNILLGRTDFSVNLFGETREQRTSLDGSPLSDERQAGMRFGASRRLGARTTLEFSAQRVRREFSTSAERDLTSATLTAAYSLGSRTELTLAYEYDEEEPVGGGTVGRDYAARLVSLLLTRRF